MQVLSNASYTYSPESNIKDLSQDQRDSIRQSMVYKAAEKSKESQVEAYVAGTKQANDAIIQNASNEEYVQDYTEFATNARKAQNYATLVENGINIFDIKNQQSIQPIENISLNEEQADTLGQGLVGLAGYKSTQDKIEAYQAGSLESSTRTESINDTAQYVKNYNEFAADARRSSYLNTYIENNNYLAG